MTKILPSLIVLIILTIVNTYYANQKNIFHGDEVLSHSLAIGEDPFFSKVENNKNWQSSKFLINNMKNNWKNFYRYDLTYRNQTWDVHPPLYYFLLKTFSNINISNEFSWIPGFLLNYILSIILLVYFYRLLVHLKINKFLILITTMAYTVNALAINLFLYQRMYQLFATLIIIYLYYDLRSTDKFDIKKISSGALGLLTHHYFIIFLFLNSIFNFTSKDKTKGNIINLCAMMSLSLYIFPASFNHITQSYRSTEIFNKVSNINFNKKKEAIENVSRVISKQLFHTKSEKAMTYFYCAFLIFLIYAIKRKNIFLIRLVLLSTVFYIVTNAISPFDDIRYTLPLTPILFIIMAIIANELVKIKKIKKVININYFILLLLISYRSSEFKQHYGGQWKSFNFLNKQVSKRALVYYKKAYEVAFATQFILKDTLFKVKKHKINEKQVLEKFDYIIDTSDSLKLDNPILNRNHIKIYKVN